MDACGRFPLILWELREEHEGNASLLKVFPIHANGAQCSQLMRCFQNIHHAPALTHSPGTDYIYFTLSSEYQTRRRRQERGGGVINSGRSTANLTTSLCFTLLETSLLHIYERPASFSAQLLPVPNPGKVI